MEYSRKEVQCQAPKEFCITKLFTFLISQQNTWSLQFISVTFCGTLEVDALEYKFWFFRIY